MLEYRDFPLKTMFIYVLLAVPMAFSIYVITGLLSGTLFGYLGMSIEDHYGLLGYGALTTVFALPLSGLLVDRIRKHDFLMYFAALIPSFIGLLSILEIGSDYTEMYPILLSTMTFGCLALMLISWSARINQSVVLRFRGRTVAVFLATAVIIASLYRYMESISFLAVLTNDITLPTMVSIVAILLSASFRPWKVARASLTITGSSFKYFVPMTFILGAHLLWYTVTNLELSKTPSFISLSQSANLGILEMVPFIISILLAGFISDRYGRKTAFRFVILLMGLLTIFGSTFVDTNWLDALLISERVVEGYLLGLCLLLIWPELGPVKSKGFRLSLYWFFFLGYMTLFWGLDINVVIMGITFDAPSLLSAVGGQMAILLSLGALYLTGPLPATLGREIEMEDLDLDFDERQVKRTVDAFVGAEDFASIRSQLDIIDASNDVSDSEFEDILGDEFKEMLPLRRVPGIGESLEKKLIAAGYGSAAQLAGESAQRLAPKIEGLSVAGAEKILKAARSVVKKTVKKKKKKK
ncbi:MAG: helix-hairpin-helix domain-containing protein [Candidatus Thorarchaeota archaeon]